MYSRQEYSKVYKEKNREAIRERTKKYNNSERGKEAKKRYNEKLKKGIPIVPKEKKTRKEFVEHYREKQTQYVENERIKRHKTKEAIFGILGCKCNKCGFLDKRALHVDHVNGGGTQERKELKHKYYQVILEKLLNGSNDYQILCANCNWIKRIENNETGDRIKIKE